MPSADKDETLFLAAVSSFAARLRELCLLLQRSFEALWGLKIVTRKSDSQTGRRRQQERKGAAGVVSVSGKMRAFTCRNLCSFIMYRQSGVRVL